MPAKTGRCEDCGAPVRRESRRCAGCSARHIAATRTRSDNPSGYETQHAFARRVGITPPAHRDLLLWEQLLEGAISAYWRRRVEAAQRRAA